MNRITKSILAPAVIESRVIPNGVDLSVFRPRDKIWARLELGLPVGTPMVLFAANGLRENIWKDYKTFRSAVAAVAKSSPEKLLFIALGESGATEKIGNGELRFVPFKENPELVARYYQAADIYLHPAKIESFGNTVLEARACGVPVIATAVGGIPEQVKSLRLEGVNSGQPTFPIEEATGLLVPEGDNEALAAALKLLLGNYSLRKLLGENAVDDVRRRFDLKFQAQTFLSWYSEILSSGNHRPLGPAGRLNVVHG